MLRAVGGGGKLELSHRRNLTLIKWCSVRRMNPKLGIASWGILFDMCTYWRYRRQKKTHPVVIDLPSKSSSPEFDEGQILRGEDDCKDDASRCKARDSGEVGNGDIWHSRWRVGAKKQFHWMLKVNEIYKALFIINPRSRWRILCYFDGFIPAWKCSPLD